ncbi:hypothetical protein BG53_07160 [Paenibacillus darwinianus]|uniref:HTH araC/xylS-type domain-containing protein n=1 Tax=Paenibacillus darwinianus TaxID=1380763 RepID=A0A9W5RYW0_9BACL|nr:helix-turn-helix domain-containing protein [Paenibacillus darwinianus]EXX85945.1 hypothetical protein CH50_08375 [Paenibacillus darwinianus]EXX86000.1 hypothetical protein BG53_07160 [Paenibacillus darwinianus]
MIFLRRIRQYRVYRRLVLSYLLLLTVTITLLSFILYLMFSARAVQEIDRSSKQMLTQVSYTANVVYDQIQDVTGQMLSDNEIMSFLYANTDSKTVDYTANLFLNRIQGVYPFIKNLSVYNFTTGAYIDSLGLQPDPHIAATEEMNTFGFYPRRVDSVTGSTSYRLLTFKIIPERSFAETPTSAIMVDLDESYIRNTMRNLSASTKDSLTFVMDASGTVLSHSSPEYFMENYAAQHEYVRTILADPDGQGSFVYNLDRQKHLVTYIKSSNLDWYFVSVRPYAELISNIYELRNWTILVVVLLVLAGAVTSFMLSGNIYNPIRTLLDKVNSTGGPPTATALMRYDEYEMLTEAFTEKIETAKSMESTIDRSARALKDSYLALLLKGNANKIAVSAEMKREWKSRLNGPCLTVILFKIDRYAAFREQYDSYNRGLIRFAVSNIAHELISRSYRSDVANADEDETALILQSEQPLHEDHLHLVLGEIQDAVHHYYGIGLSVAIGDPCGAVSEIRDSYKSAQHYIESRLFLGQGCLASRTTMQPAGSEQTSRYPSVIEKKLIDAVKLGRQPAIRAHLAEFKAYLTGCAYTSAMKYTNFLMLGIIKEFEYITEWWGVDADQLFRTLEEFRHVETLDDIEHMLTAMTSCIVDMLEENKKNTTVAKNAKLIEEIRQFVKEQYAEHGLSLEAAADHVGFSAGYIGKLFKSMTGTTFNDYVTHIRMEEAKTLLAATNDSVAHIGERVGVYNVPYFTTLFKKKYGMTPSQYREQAAKELDPV